MGVTDIERQHTRTSRKMKMLEPGWWVSPTAKARSRMPSTLPSQNGSSVGPDTFYLIGSAVGPHPFPEMVAFFQSVISEETARQVPGDYGAFPSRLRDCVWRRQQCLRRVLSLLDKPDVRPGWVSRPRAWGVGVGAPCRYNDRRRHRRPPRLEDLLL